MRLEDASESFGAPQFGGLDCRVTHLYFRADQGVPD